mmetsp:Transcript_12643/g.23060  ORF Transcript_12643/g.23060 Transcript_12643/m.23060 type:complete len:2081 (+) Transcript_12643:183-6425(+)|eukprot:CAMPEP_0182495580 /NCGR_PEP_ID=MMETSP1321-20130603/4356_1 /TAXON_ID=91990 /ORGANISM="Bolidomonas sp., Strain RCC1657" /LENGTH=2080 /DNA_ID=CAMNT_0024699001 /DNA_START=161 /DNA_END=6403 /DNA_ORIENTATION=+
MSALSEASYAKAKDFLRKCLAEAGVHGMVTLKDQFTAYDLDDSGTLDYSEFAAALLEYKLTNAEIRALFVHFDADGNGEVNYEEFVDGVRGELTPERKAVIGKVFDSIDEDADGIISLADIGRFFLPSKHPDVLSGNRTTASILNDFMDTFHLVGDNGSLTRQDFLNYFANTACFVTDEFFFTMMNNIWKTKKAHEVAAVKGSLAAAVRATPPGGVTIHPPSRKKNGARSELVSFEKAKKYLQKHIASSGVKGMVGLRDLFMEMDRDDSGALSYEEFSEVMENYKLDNQEIRALFVQFDADGSGEVDYVEFCHGIRGELNEERKTIVGEVFDGIDGDDDGVIDCGDIGRCFVLNNHPDVISRRKPANIILLEFLQTFERSGTDGKLTRDDFLEYYANVSAFIEDEPFRKMMKSIWKFNRSVKKGTLGELAKKKEKASRRAKVKVTPKKAKPVTHPADDIVDGLRYMLAKMGVRGLSTVSKNFKEADVDDSKALGKEEFKNAMRECDLKLTGKDLNLLFDYFDQDGSGEVSYDEFINTLRTPISDWRVSVVIAAFNVIDKSGDGMVTVDEVVKQFNASGHPSVISGERKTNDVLMEFLNTFEVGSTVEGKVTRDEFIDYYHNISASINSDEYWALLLARTWDIPQPKTEEQIANEPEPEPDPVLAHQAKALEGLKKLSGPKVSAVKMPSPPPPPKGAMTLSELAAQSKAVKKYEEDLVRAEEEKKEEAERARYTEPKKGKPLKIPQSLSGMISGKNIKEEMEFVKPVRKLPKPASNQKDRREIGNSRIPSPGLSVIIAKLKKAIKAHGAHGFTGLQRKFRIMDDDESGALDLGEFKKGMQELEMGLSTSELRLLFEHFDDDHSGSISFEEFIQGVRDPLTRRRLGLVNRAFDILDVDKSGVVEPAEIKDCYDARKHPDVISGNKTEDEVLREFFSTFDIGGVVDGMVTRQEFINYYTNLGANIDDDEYFELMIRNAWHIAGGEGAAASSANKRVLVTDSLGKQSVVELKNDLGLDRIPEKERADWIMNKLRQQGVDVVGLDLKGDPADEEKGDHLGPNYKPMVNQKFASAAPGVLPGTGSLINKVYKKARIADPNEAPVGVKEMLLRLKQAMKDRGASGIVGMARKFRLMDDDGNGSLDLGEFTKGMLEMDLDFSAADMKKLFDYFDCDGTGGIDYEEMVSALRTPLNALRKALVTMAFNRVDEDGSGVIEPNEILSKYDASQHPDVLASLKTEEEAIKDFIACFEVGGEVDGMVTFQEFCNYYENLGSSIDSDEYFELMIRNAWHMSGGEAQYQSSGNLRVRALLADGTTKVVELQNDLGVKPGDRLLIIKRLKKQGLHAVDIDTSGATEDEDKNGLGLEKGNRSAVVANMSLGAQYKNKKKRADPASLVVAKGKSGGAAFGEIKGATMMDALKGTGQKRSLGDRSRAKTGEAHPGTKMIIQSLKRQIRQRGGSGMVGLSRKFRIMDDSGDGELQFREFKKAMKEMEFDLNDKDLHKVFDHFDADGGGSVSYEEFIQGVRDPLSERRINLINMAFDIIDKDGSGVIEAHEVAGSYDASKHPEVISGKKTAKQVLEEFLNTFDVGGIVDGAVTKQEFTNYYHNISASIFNEDYFELMIRNAWHISGGEGAAASSANKRVLVTDKAGKQTVVEIKNDLGLDRIPEKEKNAEIMKRLKKQGVDVANVDTQGGVDDEEVAADPNAPNPTPLDEMKQALSMGKGQGGLSMKGRSQIVMSGGKPEDDVQHRKAMGLAYQNNPKGNAARASSIGMDGLELEHDGFVPADYKPSGVQGPLSPKKGTSLSNMAKEGQVQDVLEELRDKLKSRGARGISTLARKFRVFDENGDKTLDPQEFAKALRSCNLQLSGQKLVDLFNFFDKDGGGTITYDEFLNGVRGPIAACRLEILEEAFAAIDTDGSNFLEPAELVAKYEVKHHPDVLTGKRSEDEVLREFLDTFDIGQEKEGQASRGEFFSYYCNLGLGIESDEYFELMIRNAWGLPGGREFNDACEGMRVMVLHKDGKEEVVEIKDIVGLRHGDKTEAKRRLRREGHNPDEVRFFDIQSEEDEKAKKPENKNFGKTFSLG